MAKAKETAAAWRAESDKAAAEGLVAMVEQLNTLWHLRWYGPRSVSRLAATEVVYLATLLQEGLAEIQRRALNKLNGLER